MLVNINNVKIVIQIIKKIIDIDNIYLLCIISYIDSIPYPCLYLVISILKLKSFPTQHFDKYIYPTLVLPTFLVLGVR